MSHMVQKKLYLFIGFLSSCFAQLISLLRFSRTERLLKFCSIFSVSLQFLREFFISSAIRLILQKASAMSRQIEDSVFPDFSANFRKYRTSFSSVADTVERHHMEVFVFDGIYVIIQLMYECCKWYEEQKLISGRGFLESFWQRRYCFLRVVKRRKAGGIW